MPSIRVSSCNTSGALGAKNHCQRERDKAKKSIQHVDKAKSHLNQTITPPNETFHPKEAFQDYKKHYEEHTGQKVQKKTKPFMEGVIYFHNDEKKLIEKHKNKLNQYAIKTINNLKDKLNLNDKLFKKSFYMVRHEDEETTHYHFIVPNVSNEYRTVQRKLTTKDLEKLQDMTADTFKQLDKDFQRGIKGSKAKHKDFRQHKYELEKEKRNLKKTKENLSKEIKNLKKDMKKSIPKDIYNYLNLTRRFYKNYKKYRDKGLKKHKKRANKYFKKVENFKFNTDLDKHKKHQQKIEKSKKKINKLNKNNKGISKEISF